MSVVVPTRERPDQLRRAVLSVLRQSYPGRIDCIIVHDRAEPVPFPVRDGSDRSVVVTVNSRTPGVAGARNTGALMADGDLLAFCDDDDEWLSGKLVRQVVALRARSEASAVTCGVQVWFRGHAAVRLPDADLVTLSDLTRSRSTAVHTSTFLVRRDDYLGAIGPVDESMPGGYGEDYEWLLRAARWKPLVAVRQPLVRVAWHDASWFDGKWDMVIAGIHALLRKHPEIRDDPRGLARLYGRLAFAHAASGRTREARTWVRLCLRQNWRERRAYLALAVSLGLIRARSVLDVAHRWGRGV